MPLYEYFCQPCNGIFEELRPMREATEPVPCPECYKDACRIMPTSFAAFTFRDGYPRRIPDDGKFYHLGQKVIEARPRASRTSTRKINKPKPKKRRAKGEQEEIKDMREAAARATWWTCTGTPWTRRSREDGGCTAASSARARQRAARHPPQGMV